ncbi:hypothetical protein ACFWMR_31190 [Amycolatopsis thailandensis]|uniref:hypothetical protein n=1 Tax=Amycolatopsis thailandensis TaxID=589330 RepID=UPI0036585F48
MSMTGVLETLERVLANEPVFSELPPDVQLAVALSPATRIEPELIRAVRLRALPRLDVSSETDLWFADWIGFRGTTGIALRAELLPTLRTRLRGLLDESLDDAPIHDVWAVFEGMHENSLSPLLRLEERINEKVLTGRDGEPELKRVLYSLVVEDRSGIVDWAYGAWKRLPADVLRTATAWQLRQVLNDRLEGERLASVGPFEDVTPGLVAPIAAALGRRELAFTRDGGRMRIGGEPGEHSVFVKVPDSDPVLLGVFSDTGERPVSIPAGGHVWVDVGEDGFHGRSGDGRIIRVFDPPDRPVALAPADRLPSKLLARADRMAAVGREAELAELTAWLTKADPLAVRLLYSDPDRGLRQLAHALAAEATARGWVVLWPSAPAVSLTGEFPARGLLVIVDGGSRWEPEDFAGLAHALPPVARVLVLDNDAGAWWEVVRRSLDRAPASQQRVRPLPAPSRVMAASIDVFCGMLGRESRPPAPAAEAADSTYEVQIVALAAVLQGAPARFSRPGKLVETLCEHESARWSLSVEGRLRLAAVVLVATLAFPLPRGEAADLLTRLRVARDQEDARRVLDLHERWYPSSDIVAPLKPAHLVTSVLRLALDGDGCFGLTGDQARGLVTLLLADDSAAARRAADTLLMNSPSSSLLAEVVLKRPELVRRAPGGVAERFVALSGPELLERLWEAESGGATPLITALVLERIIRLDGDRTVDQALSLNRELARRYADAGLLMRGVRVLAEVVRRIELKATAHPDVYRPALLEVLGDYSACLLKAGKKADAVRVAQDAVKLSKQVNQADLTVHQRHLASALLGYSADLLASGQAGGAAEATGDAVRIHRDLRSLGENQYEEELAGALHVHAKVLLASERRADAVAALRESSVVFSRLANGFSAAFEGRLAEVSRLLAQLDES